MSRSAAPARRAMAMPSPVATGGFVVSANTWPAPPVASSVARASTVVSASPASARKRQPTTRPSAHHEVGRAGERAHRRCRRVAGVFSSSARTISQPVASPQRVEHAVARVGALAREVEAARLAVEARAPGRQLADPLRALLDQHARGRPATRCPPPPPRCPSRCRSARSSAAQRHRHAALRVAGVALGGLVLGHDQHAAVPGEAERRAQAGDARSPGRGSPRGRSRCHWRVSTLKLRSLSGKRGRPRAG